MGLEFRAAICTTLEMLFEKERLFRVEFTIDVRCAQVPFADCLLIAVRHLDSGNSLLNKLLPHHLAGAKEAVLDGTQRQSRYFHDLFVAEVLRMTKDD